MTVKELIKILEQVDENRTITVWDAYHDDYETEVSVSMSKVDHTIHIGNNVFGVDITD